MYEVISGGFAKGITAGGYSLKVRYGDLDIESANGQARDLVRFHPELPFF